MSSFEDFSFRADFEVHVSTLGGFSVCVCLWLLGIILIEIDGLRFTGGEVAWLVTALFCGLVGIAFVDVCNVDSGLSLIDVVLFFSSHFFAFTNASMNVQMSHLPAQSHNFGMQTKRDAAKTALHADRHITISIDHFLRQFMNFLTSICSQQTGIQERTVAEAIRQ